MCARILVAGGNGFIGSAISREAVEQGHEVVAMSRDGRPKGDEPWMDRVEWLQANVLAPEEWRDRLSGCDAVIHSVALDREHPEEGLTYERVYRDSVAMMAWEAENARVGRFVCISSSAKPPFRSDRYLESKREGEATLRGRSFKETILRPSYVYRAGDKAGTVVGGMLQTVVRVPGMRRTLSKLRPLRVDQVASAAVRAATEDGYEGVINPDNIAYLANGHTEERMKAADQATVAPTRRLRMNRGMGFGLAAVGIAASAAAAVLTQRRMAARRPRGLKRIIASMPWR